MFRAALGQRELDDGGSAPLTTTELPIVRRRATWMVLAAAAIALAAAAVVHAIAAR